MFVKRVLSWDAVGILDDLPWFVSLSQTLVVMRPPMSRKVDRDFWWEEIFLPNAFLALGCTASCCPALLADTSFLAFNNSLLDYMRSTRCSWLCLRASSLELFLNYTKVSYEQVCGRPDLIDLCVLAPGGFEPSLETKRGDAARKTSNFWPFRFYCFIFLNW